MMRSLYSAVSGLRTHQSKMDVLGNNIANVNTVAFKSSSVTFNDVLYQTVSNASGTNTVTGTGGVNAKQIGLGVTTAATKIAITTEGATQTTGDSLDLKISGQNFFVVSNGQSNLFTRDGSFYIDGTGNLCMSSTGYNVMGWQLATDATTQSGYVEPRVIQQDTVSKLTPMSANNMVSPPAATENASLSGIIDNNTSALNNGGYVMTLNFYDTLGFSYTAKFSMSDPDTTTVAGKTYFSMKLTDILNSEGESILGATAANTIFPDVWAQYNASTGVFEEICTRTITGGTGTAADPYTYAFNQAAAQYRVVDDNGKTTGVKLNIATTDGDNSLPLDNLTAINADSNFRNISIDMTTSYNYDNDGTSTLSMTRGDTDGSNAGYPVGSMTGLTIDSTGCIYGTYNNGTTLLLCQIATAAFANASGLESLGNNCYATTLNSGEFDGIGQDISANAGTITSGVLEMSNVDLSAEFTNMITTQRGFQANSRVITTSDSLLEELINLKR